MITVDMLKKLEGTRLPGGSIEIAPHEDSILQRALHASDAGDTAHPMWFIIISLRCMGIDVDELGEMAGQSVKDTLLFGNCEVLQNSPLRVGGRYWTDAELTVVGSRTARDGSRLDSLEVRVRISDVDTAAVMGQVTSTYLYKRGES
ncbi:hypothetical protein [Jongsikchunia kroppenstedtii]|uniref:hypothetical protein n=1 Tax=Jongsikchunia kroppenstedtii TaxID=1121721 RepID=UPI0003A56708|nr:hypothetical protein [Jongsikchunia kroppenstedtii]